MSNTSFILTSRPLSTPPAPRPRIETVALWAVGSLILVLVLVAVGMSVVLVSQV